MCIERIYQLPVVAFSFLWIIYWRLLKFVLKIIWLNPFGAVSRSRMALGVLVSFSVPFSLCCFPHRCASITHNESHFSTNCILFKDDLYLPEGTCINGTYTWSLNSSVYCKIKAMTKNAWLSPTRLIPGSWMYVTFLIYFVTLLILSLT